MARWLATKTIAAIDEALSSDGGARFRQTQGKVLPHIEDAYRGEEDAHRSHLGASVIGQACARAIAYGWRWASKKVPRGKKNEPPKKAASRMIRLWNRGHLEEGRFISMLLVAGIAVYQQDANGRQYRIASFGGHFSGSGDGILMNVPDLPQGVPALGEFKTHSGKSFEGLVEDGAQKAKPEHYAQMQEYMHHFGLLYALYLAVNKDTDELYAEIVQYDRPVAEHFLQRAKQIIFEKTLPARIKGGNPGFFQCKYLCDYTDVCYDTVKPQRNCRTCQHWFPMPDGTFQCTNETQHEIRNWPGVIELTKEMQAAGCESYELGDEFK